MALSRPHQIANVVSSHNPGTLRNSQASLGPKSLMEVPLILNSEYMQYFHQGLPNCVLKVLQYPKEKDWNFYKGEQRFEILHLMSELRKYTLSLDK